MPEYQIVVTSAQVNFKTEWTTDMEETIKAVFMFRTRLYIGTVVDVYCRDVVKITSET